MDAKFCADPVEERDRPRPWAPHTPSLLLLLLTVFFACAESDDAPGTAPRGSGGAAVEPIPEATGGVVSASGGTGGGLVLGGGMGGACDPALNDCMLAVCGNGMLEDISEECDDGNDKAGDGCSDRCLLEAGWVCPILGAACRAAQCGDAMLAGLEECDNGASNGMETAVNGTICDENCRFVADPEKCGNEAPDPGEGCDDGNFDLGDGCTPLCEREPDCSAGACTSRCGDGIKFTDEECDDGNIRDDDGCSSACKVEPGYVCKEVEVAPDPLILPVVYRDFQGRPTGGGCPGPSVQECLATAGCHPDFERYSGAGCSGPAADEAGIVQAVLDTDAKPVHVALSKPETVNNDAAAQGTDFFAMWYRDVPNYNKTILGQLSFEVIDPNANNRVYRFSSNSFFPIDDKGWGNISVPSACASAADGAATRNYHFTSEVRYWFEYQGNEQLDFFGDDDLWVFVNRRLAVDLGGNHASLNGGIILHASDGTAQACDHLAPCDNRRTMDLGLVLGRVYEIAVFHAERHTCSSRYQLTLSKFNAIRSECTSVCGDGVVTRDEACDDGKNDGSYGTCKADCSRAPFCGDGTKQEPPEQCDDGNRKNGDGCSANCRFEDIR